MMSEFLGQFISLMNTGGAVMWVLFVLNLMLWYGLGYRYLLMRRGTLGNVRRLIEKHEKRGDKQAIRGILDNAAADALHAAAAAKTINRRCRNFVVDALFPYMIEVGRYSTMIKTIVVLAPLVGLLGTVMGMIETFDALQTGSMFSQGNSISGGISKALFTTELGLVVAVPGLILGKILDRKEERYELEFEQIADIICTKDSDEI
ncbi:MAG: MotA/TolQ/ExbB proton channel family protein [Campylobacterota bacterium]|nr:MotA/TolQ/ExbB proton channel family protein [Campylobacterota bacterium]